MYAIKLFLVSGLIIPPKFKTTEFTKYDGTSYLAIHFTMYYRKMARYTENEKLLIHYFQDSLSGSAARWYLKFDHHHIRFWRSFLAQYKHLMDMAPERLSFQNLKKKVRENFKEYTQR